MHSLFATLTQAEYLTAAINELDLDSIRYVIDKADLAYYRTGTSLISDEIYDALKQHLRRECPPDERNTRVGPPYSVDELRNKVTHSIPMGSLDNTDDGILGYPQWYESITKKIGTNPSICVSPKIDGSSICATYVDGKLVRVASRGNGEVGEDITANACQFRGLPLHLPEKISCDVRGEAILFLADFHQIMEREHGKPFDQIPRDSISNPRNVGNGILSRDSGQDADKITFLAFNIVAPDQEYGSEMAKLLHLKQLGISTVDHTVCDSIAELQSYYEKIVSVRDNLPYEIDGIVAVVDSIEQQQMFVTDDPKSLLRPKYARAIKLAHKSAITTVLGVEQTVGHTGAIIPTAILKTVRIGGVNVSRALLNNWEEINRLGVAIGDEVQVVLAGDIIPKIVAVVNRPTKIYQCPSCDYVGDEDSQLAKHIVDGL